MLVSWESIADVWVNEPLKAKDSKALSSRLILKGAAWSLFCAGYLSCRDQWKVVHLNKIACSNLTPFFSFISSIPINLWMFQSRHFQLVFFIPGLFPRIPWKRNKYLSQTFNLHQQQQQQKKNCPNIEKSFPVSWESEAWLKFIFTIFFKLQFFLKIPILYISAKFFFGKCLLDKLSPNTWFFNIWF